MDVEVETKLRPEQLKSLTSFTQKKKKNNQLNDFFFLFRKNIDPKGRKFKVTYLTDTTL